MQKEPSTLYLYCDAVLSNDTPTKYLPILHTIRTIQDWKDAGFKIAVDRYDNIKSRNRHVHFTKVYDFTDTIWEAIRTKKKHVRHAWDVYFFLKRGYTFDDFVSVTSDIQKCCNALGFYDNQQFESARHEIKSAISIAPDEHSYHSLFFDLCFLLEDTSVIEDEINYNLRIYRGISSMVHSGHVERWIRLLAKLKKYEEAAKLINRANALLDQQINQQAETTSEPRDQVFKIETDIAPITLTFQNPTPDNTANDIAFARAKKEQFNKRLSSLKERLLKHGVVFTE